MFVPVSGNYMLGWNAFVEYSEGRSTFIVYDFANIGTQERIKENDTWTANMTNSAALNAYKGFLTQNGWTFVLSSSWHNDEFDGLIYLGVYNSAGVGYIEKVLPSYRGTLTVKYANPYRTGATKIYLDGIAKETTLPETTLPGTFTTNFTPGQTLKIQEEEQGVLYVLSVEITNSVELQRPPLIRLEKNGSSLIEGGQDNGQNETRHIVNHLEKGDKLRLSVYGFFQLRGLKGTTFYGYLLDSTNLSTNVGNNLNLNGNLTVGGQLLISDTSNNLVDAVPKILSGPDHLTCILIAETQQLTNADEHLKISNIYSRNGSPLENYTIVPVEWNTSYYKSVFKNTSGGTITLMVDVHGGISNASWEMWSATNLDPDTIPNKFTTSHVKSEISQTDISGRRIMHTFIVSVQNNHYLHIAIKSSGNLGDATSDRNDLYTTIDLVKL